ncbi:MAG TPA: hypothetical protein PKM43_14480 [Verrucomicrobiota bacterium]|nr:hypothetical protein [Verrucomicrobiota bacterium]
MKTRWLLYTLAGVLCAAPLSASSAAPFGWFGFNGTIYNLPSSAWQQDTDGAWGVTFNYRGPSYAVGGVYRVMQDQWIAYGVAAQNHSPAAGTFTFGITSSSSRPAELVPVSASFAASFTDLTGDGLHFTPRDNDADNDGLYEVQVCHVGQPLTNLGVDLGEEFHVDSGFPGDSYVSGGYLSEPRRAPPGAWTSFGLETTFDLSGLGDIATANGALMLDRVAPIPEPASALLLTPGLAGALLWQHRRSRRRRDPRPRDQQVLHRPTSETDA